jgi:hypothetical protein
MHTEIQSQSSTITQTAADVVLRIARSLHRAAYSDSLSVSLPILRRLLTTLTLTAVSLPELQRHRDVIQRKHILRMLAVEAGFTAWEDYRHALNRMSVDELTHYEYVKGSLGYPNLWFSTYEEAQTCAKEQSSRAVRAGTQALVSIY